MSGRLAGKRALITGGASGIGLAVAERYLREGASVAILDRDAARADRAGASLGEIGRVIVSVGDVTDEAAVAALVDGIGAKWGGLDVAVANAALYEPPQDGPGGDLELSFFLRTLEVNVAGVLLTCKHAIRAMRGGTGGSVICTGSPTGVTGGLGSGLTAYGTSKAAVHALARMLAVDHGHEGIRVNVVIPGFTRTPLTEHILADPVALADTLRRVALGRPGEPEDVTGAFAFLASDDAAFVTGAVIAADGGITAS